MVLLIKQTLEGKKLRKESVAKQDKKFPIKKIDYLNQFIKKI